MPDRSLFTDDEWKALAEAPLRMTLALVTVGKHNPITVVKEAAASARATARPTEQGPADDLIKEIGRDSESHESRHDVKAHLGQTPQDIVDEALAGLAPAAAALGKLSTDEAAEVRAWFLDIANAVVAASKSATSEEQDVIAKITRVFAPSPT